MPFPAMLSIDVTRSAAAEAILQDVDALLRPFERTDILTRTIIVRFPGQNDFLLFAQQLEGVRARHPGAFDYFVVLFDPRSFYAPRHRVPQPVPAARGGLALDGRRAIAEGALEAVVVKPEEAEALLSRMEVSRGRLALDVVVPPRRKARPRRKASPGRRRGGARGARGGKRGGASAGAARRRP
jgi:hypothetical protein